MFWNTRKDRQVTHFSKVLTLPEKLLMLKKLYAKYHLKGVFKAFENEKKFFEVVLLMEPWVTANIKALKPESASPTCGQDRSLRSATAV